MPQLAPSLLLGVLLTGNLFAGPLAIDLDQPPAAVHEAPYGPGVSKNPQGVNFIADSESFFLNGKPWIPIAGEFHYSRYPRAEWRTELLKMKAGGINTVSTYVFWIHQEEEPGKFDWSGQRSLRDFLRLCQEVGLKVFVRLGPWCHGEVRNGGFPDWVQNSGVKLRSTDPAFMKMVESLYREEERQMHGLLWKDGGPVIGVQVDNENANGAYLLALKSLAQSVGIDVPFYAITGWQGGIPNAGLLPLFGGYFDGFWGGKLEKYRREYLFTEVRVVNDLGAQLVSKNPTASQIIEQFPYACVEIGGGMMSGYNRRIKVDPPSIAALALTKLGNGNNLPGYYMYQGGTNPAGELSWLNEEHPSQLPHKDYDFQTALGAAGQVREQYHLLRMQHLFLEDFGEQLARMPASFPEQRPKDLEDFATLRWDMRSNGKSGFLFFNNQQPYVPLPEHKDVQFSVKTASGVQLIPAQPITIPSGSYGFLPVNWDCSGVQVQYATAQPLCRAVTGKGEPVYFLSALEGIAPELAIHLGQGQSAPAGSQASADGVVHFRDLKPGPSAAVQVKTANGQTVSFVVLSSAQGKSLWRLPLAGKDRLMLSTDPVFANQGSLHVQLGNGAASSLSVFPPLSTIEAGKTKLSSTSDGVFARFDLPAPTALPVVEVPVVPEKAAGPKATTLQGMQGAAWDDAAVYQLKIPATAAGRQIILNFHYLGDAARLYVGDQLFDDHFYNGDAFPIALWRIPVSDWSKIRLKVMPYSDALMNRLPVGARDAITQAKTDDTLSKITVSTEEPRDLVLIP